MTIAARDLVFDDITKQYKTARGEITILDGVSLTVKPGETVAIVGPSGSGKSTLLNIAGSLDKPTSGSVRLGDIQIDALGGKSLAEFRANQVGFIFQDHHLLPQLTALENVLLPTIAQVPGMCAELQPSTLTPTLSLPGRGSRRCSSQTSPSRARGELAASALLDRVGILARAEAFPAQMSGGERQRVAIARALINGAKLLLCDEPTGNLDRAAGENVISLLLELASEQGATVVMVTHNAAHAARFSRTMELADGKLQI